MKCRRYFIWRRTVTRQGEESRPPNNNRGAGGHKTSGDDPELSPKLSRSPPDAGLAISPEWLRGIQQKSSQQKQLCKESAGMNLREDGLENEGGMIPGMIASGPGCRKVDISRITECVAIIKVSPDSCGRVVPP